MQAGKQLRGMLNDFSIPPCGSPRGQRRDLGCRRRQLPGTGTGSQRKVAQPCHKPTLLQGLGGCVAWLQEFWQWPGTELFSGMSLRLCKGISPGHFFSYKISPTLPICPTTGDREGCLATLHLQLTLQKYQQQTLQLRIVAAVPLLAGKLAEAKVHPWPQLHPGDVCHLVHTRPLLSRPLHTLAAAGQGQQETV